MANGPVPSLIVIGSGADPTRVLVLSQVLLSFGLPFAVVPLLMFTSRADIMGVRVNRRSTTLLLGVVVTVIVALNLFLLYMVFAGG